MNPYGKKQGASRFFLLIIQEIPDEGLPTLPLTEGRADPEHRLRPQPGETPSIEQYLLCPTCGHFIVCPEGFCMCCECV